MSRIGLIDRHDGDPLAQAEDNFIALGETFSGLPPEARERLTDRLFDYLHRCRADERRLSRLQAELDAEKLRRRRFAGQLASLIKQCEADFRARELVIERAREQKKAYQPDEDFNFALGAVITDLRRIQDVLTDTV